MIELIVKLECGTPVKYSSTPRSALYPCQTSTSRESYLDPQSLIYHSIISLENEFWKRSMQCSLRKE